MLCDRTNGNWRRHKKTRLQPAAPDPENLHLLSLLAGLGAWSKSQRKDSVCELFGTTCAQVLSRLPRFDGIRIVRARVSKYSLESEEDHGGGVRNHTAEV